MTTILAFVFFLARSHDLERSIDHLIRGASGTTPQVPGEGKKIQEISFMKAKKVGFVLPDLLSPLRMLKMSV